MIPRTVFDFSRSPRVLELITHLVGGRNELSRALRHDGSLIILSSHRELSRTRLRKSRERLQIDSRREIREGDTAETHRWYQSDSDTEAGRSATLRRFVHPTGSIRGARRRTVALRRAPSELTSLRFIPVAVEHVDADHVLAGAVEPAVHSGPPIGVDYAEARLRPNRLPAAPT